MLNNVVPLRIGLVGFGRLGRAIVRTFPGEVVAINARSARGRESEELAGGTIPFVDTGGILTTGNPDLVWLSVPDDAIRDVVRSLTETARSGSPIPAILHSSGSLGVDVLEPVADLGALTGALHPNLIVDGTRPFPSRATWGVTGSPQFLELSAKLLVRLDPRIVPVSESDRSLYHAAATLAANYPILLADFAEGLYRTIGFPDGDARAVVGAYLRSVADRVESSNPSVLPIDLMTGPIVRRDRETLEGHLNGLRRRGMHREATLLEALIELARRRLDDQDPS